MKKIWYNFLTKLRIRKRGTRLNFAANFLFEKRKRPWPVNHCHEFISAIASGIVWFAQAIGGYGFAATVAGGALGSTISWATIVAYGAFGGAWYAASASLTQKPSHKSFNQGKEFHVLGGSIVDYFEKGAK